MFRGLSLDKVRLLAGPVGMCRLVVIMFLLMFRPVEVMLLDNSHTLHRYQEAVQLRLQDPDHTRALLPAAA